MLENGFWDDQAAAQAVIDEANGLKDLVNEYKELSEMQENLEVTYELVKEEKDLELEKELQKNLKELIERLNAYELALLLNDPYDQNNAILELHPGAGGTESQDWGSILLRMYTRWAEKKGFKVETLNYQAGD